MCVCVCVCVCLCVCVCVCVCVVVVVVVVVVVAVVCLFVAAFAFVCVCFSFSFLIFFFVICHLNSFCNLRTLHETLSKMPLICKKDSKIVSGVRFEFTFLFFFFFFFFQTTVSGWLIIGTIPERKIAPQVPIRVTERATCLVKFILCG